MLDSQLVRDGLQALGTDNLSSDSYRTNFFDQFNSVLLRFDLVKRSYAAHTPSDIKFYLN